MLKLGLAPTRLLKPTSSTDEPKLQKRPSKKTLTWTASRLKLDEARKTMASLNHLKQTILNRQMDLMSKLVTGRRRGGKVQCC